MPDNQPLVSVIMNCLNCEKYLKEAIDSVYAQTYKNWEIIFWDNASTDSSAEIAKSYDEKLRYFRGEETIPLGAARNKALEQAKGEFIAFLDCDDLWMPEKLEKQVPLFGDPDVGLVFCDTIIFNHRGNLSRYFKYINPPRGNVFSVLLSSYFLDMSSVIIRSSVLDKQKDWFDHRFQVAEEKDFFLRIARKYDFEFIDEPLIKLRIHDDSDSHRKFEFFAVENELILKKFIECYQSFEQDYTSEIGEVRKKIAFQKAIGLWINGKPRAARMVLRPYILQRKHFMFYIASYLPAMCFNALFTLYKSFSKLTIYNNRQD